MQFFLLFASLVIAVFCIDSATAEAVPTSKPVIAVVGTQEGASEKSGWNIPTAEIPLDQVAEEAQKSLEDLKRLRRESPAILGYEGKKVTNDAVVREMQRVTSDISSAGDATAHHNSGARVKSTAAVVTPHMIGDDALTLGKQRNMPHAKILSRDKTRHVTKSHRRAPGLEGAATDEAISMRSESRAGLRTERNGGDTSGGDDDSEKYSYYYKAPGQMDGTFDKSEVDNNTLLNFTIRRIHQIEDNATNLRDTVGNLTRVVEALNQSVSNGTQVLMHHLGVLESRSKLLNKSLHAKTSEPVSNDDKVIIQKAQAKEHKAATTAGADSSGSSADSQGSSADSSGSSADSSGSSADSSGSSVDSHGSSGCHFYKEFPFACLHTEEEKKEQDEHLKKRLLAAFYIMIGIIVMAHFFEHLVHDVCHHTLQESPVFLELFNHLLAELTVLGFIGTVGFIMCRIKVVRKMDRALFGVPPPEYFIDKKASHDYREGHLLTELMVLFEDFHYIFFAVMCIYIIVIFWLGNSVKSWLEEMDMAEHFNPSLLEAEYEGLKKKLKESHQEMKMVVKWRVKRAMATLKRFIDYHALRFDIIKPIGRPQPEIFSTGIGKDSADTFKFVDYMKSVLGPDICSTADVPVLGLITLLLVWVIEDACRLGMGKGKTGGQVVFIVGMLIFPWFAFLCIHLVWFMVNRIYNKILPQVEEKEDAQPLMKQLLDHYKGGEIDLDAVKPPYLKAEPIEKSKNFVIMWWYGTNKPMLQEQLFVRYRNGPRMCQDVIRVVLLNCAIVVAMSYTAFLVYAPKFSAKNAWLPILTLLPALLTIIWLPKTLCQLCLVTACGELTRTVPLRVALQSSQSHVRLRKCLRLLVVVDKLKQVMTMPEKDQEEMMKGHTDFFNKLPDVTQRLYIRAFNLAKGEGEDAKLEEEELPKVLEMIGLPTPPETIFHDWFSIFDNDASGSITEEEYLKLVGAFHNSLHSVSSEDELLSLFTTISGDAPKEEKQEQGKGEGEGEGGEDKPQKRKSLFTPATSEGGKQQVAKQRDPEDRLTTEQITAIMKALGLDGADEMATALFEAVRREFPDGLKGHDAHGHGGGHGHGHEEEKDDEVDHGDTVTPREIAKYLHIVEKKGSSF